MEINKFKQSTSGRLIKTNRDFWAFVPNKLPPEIEYTKNIINLLSEASISLGTLSGIGSQLPNPDLLITPYMKREAVLSSKIEGTQASLSDLFYFEAASDGKNNINTKSDVLEVVNYVSAMNYGLKRLNGLPLSNRLIREVHKKLMSGVRGEHLTPGEFRTSQNWIGTPGCSLNDAKYVPPPVNEMMELLSDLEKFFHDKSTFPLLIQCAVIHYQFEAVHPFLDGNGRIGRLLLTLFLCEREYLAQPMLYLSAFFEKYRSEYYNRLLAVSETGAWNDWLEFFLQAVITQSKDAIENSKSILSLLENYRGKAHKAKASRVAIRLLEKLFKNPYTTIPYAVKILQTTYPTAKASINKLTDIGILTLLGTKKRGKMYCADGLLKLLDK